MNRLNFALTSSFMVKKVGKDVFLNTVCNDLSHSIELVKMSYFTNFFILIYFWGRG